MPYLITSMPGVVTKGTLLSLIASLGSKCCEVENIFVLIK